MFKHFCGTHFPREVASSFPFPNSLRSIFQSVGVDAARWQVEKCPNTQRLHI